MAVGLASLRDDALLGETLANIFEDAEGLHKALHGSATVNSATGTSSRLPPRWTASRR